jgi:pimeloyl-ACP methyl ester carboxylesterase
MIEIDTPKGKFHVWTKRVGNNPRIKVLLLHGGPGGHARDLRGFDSYFPGAGIEYYYYDQLGSAYSDQPDDPRCGHRPLRRRGRAGAHRAQARQGQLLPATGRAGAASSASSTRSSTRTTSRAW